jgi:hypothetical protein
MGQKVVQQELDQDADSTWGQCARFSHKSSRWDVKTVPNQMGNMYHCHSIDRSPTSVVVDVAATTTIASTL